MRAILIRLLLIVVVCTGLQSCTSTHAGEVNGTLADNGKQLVISFDFQRGGIASSQYAIWIENEAGELVRTVYATSFTVKGGYEYRQDALPLWVGKAGPGKMKASQVDAITGATPRNGTLSYVWNGKDDEGNSVPEGNYCFFIEGTTYWKSRVIYSGMVHWDGPEQKIIPVREQRIHPSETNRDMITNLKASYSNH